MAEPEGAAGGRAGPGAWRNWGPCVVLRHSHRPDRTIRRADAAFFALGRLTGHPLYFAIAAQILSRQQGGRSMSSAVSATSSARNPYTSGNFRVEIQGITATSFSEVSGLEASIDVVDYPAGDAKLHNERKHPGLNQFLDITLN